MSNTQRINIIAMPEKVIEIVATEITESYELFIVCEASIKPQGKIDTENHRVGYKIFKCELDKPSKGYNGSQVLVVKLLLEFSRASIENSIA
jgi:hypothetical protein